MGSNKRPDAAWEMAYAPHLQAGARYANDPQRSRELRIESMITRVLTEQCLNRFKWTGLPSSIDPRYLELNLLRYGLAVFYLEPTMGKYLALQGSPAGIINWEENPTSFQVVGNLMLSRRLSAMDCVPIWSNYMRQPDLDIISIYASRLAGMDRTIEINAKNARRPRIAATNENQRLSLANMNKQIDEGNAVITVDTDQWGVPGAGASLPIAALDLGVDPDVLEKMHILRTRQWGECMGMLGFDFANQDKKERLVASEVDANNSQVDGMRAVNLNARQQACLQINKKFGLDVWVEYHITSETSAAMPVPGEQPETEKIQMSNDQVS